MWFICYINDDPILSGILIWLYLFFPEDIEIISKFFRIIINILGIPVLLMSLLSGLAVSDCLSPYGL